MSQTRLVRLSTRLALGLVALVLPLYGYKVWIKTDYTDFIVYYRAGLRWLAQEYAAIYTLADGASPMRYAPPFLPFFGLLAYFPRGVAQLLWYFLQFIAFAAGFAVLARTLRVAGASKGASQAAVAIAFLFTLRLILDAFTIGQISGLMFLSFTVCLWGFVRKRTWLLAAGGLFPAWLKIGPGILLLLALGVRDPRRGWAKTALPLFVLSLCAVILPLWSGSIALHDGSYFQLWQNWAMIVRQDSQYYDASHYGSQSLNSVLLRWAHSGAITTPHAAAIYTLCAGALILGLLSFWWLRRPATAGARILFFSQGLISVMVLMPETFKYSLIPMAIPLAALLAIPLDRKPLTRLTWGAFFVTALVVSLPGKDVVGDTLFFMIQRLNLPFAGVLVLFAAVNREAWLRSKPSALGRALETESPEPWKKAPNAESAATLALILVPLESDSRITIQHAARALRHLQPFLGQCPVVFVPWGKRASPEHPVMRVLSTASNHSVLWLPNAREFTAAQCLRQAALLTPHSQGIYLNLEQLPDGPTLARALRSAVAQGQVRVWSRRAPASELEFNGRSLALAYRRYRAGARLQALLKRLPMAPTNSLDLQSDAWQLHRADFLRISSLAQLSDGLWQTELRLIAMQMGLGVTEESAHFLIADEKPNSRMTREILSIARSWWTLRTTPRVHLQPLPALPALTADDWGLSSGVNRGILDLVSQGVLRRVSVMAHGEALATNLDALLTHAAAGRVQLGLHFDLTYAPAYRKRLRSQGRPARALITWLTLTKSARTKLAQTALIEQLAILREHRIPTQYLDGHHHIHLLPGLLDAITPTLNEAAITQVRIPTQPRRWFSGRAPIHWLARIALGRLRALGLRPTADAFLYPTIEEFSNRGKLRRLLQMHPNAEILTHPAQENDLGQLSTPEPYYQTERLMEYHHLSLIPLWQGTQG